MARKTREEKPFVRKKFRKPRKPMTEEQKAAAAERLAKAREKRQQSAGPPKGVHPTVLALPDEETFSLKNVRSWIKYQKEKIAELRPAVRRNEKGAIAALKFSEGYVRHMEAYIRGGDWIDDRYGADAQNKCRQVCIAMAYHPDGTPKRTIGTYYKDIGVVWEQGMTEENFASFVTSDEPTAGFTDKQFTMEDVK